jgi:hypothetical protein
MENGWAELPEELLTKVLVQAVEQCTPQDGGWGTGAGGACRCKASATVRLVCSGWKCRHDALMMRLLLRKDATDERADVQVRRGGGSLDLKCFCLILLDTRYAPYNSTALSTSSTSRTASWSPPTTAINSSCGSAAPPLHRSAMRCRLSQATLAKRFQQGEKHRHASSGTPSGDARDADGGGGRHPASS